jgi:hypothetical protein
MDYKTHLVEGLKHNIGFVSRTLADLSDADMFVRPCPAANHAAWQIGHIISSESSVVKNLSPANAVALPPGFIEAYNKEASKNSDPSQFAPVNTKAELLELFTKVRNSSVAWVESLSAEQLDSPSPDKYKMWAPTYGALVSGQIGHTMMHVGQFQVIRRKLGKPVLF